MMTSVNVLKYGVSSPADISPLKKLEADGYTAEDILAVIGKSEGESESPIPCVD
jgi:cyanuric acid amidohydrolase